MELHNQILEELKDITTGPFNPMFLEGFVVEQIGFNLGIAEPVVRRVLGDVHDTYVLLYEGNKVPLTSK